MNSPAIGNLNQDAIDYRVYLFDKALTDLELIPGMEVLSYEEFVSKREEAKTDELAEKLSDILANEAERIKEAKPID